jgi:hypothetical protein
MVHRERAQSLFSSTTPTQPSRVWQHLLVNGWCIAATGWRGLNPFIFVHIIGWMDWRVEVLCVGNGHAILMEKAPAKILGRGDHQCYYFHVGISIVYASACILIWFLDFEMAGRRKVSEMAGRRKVNLAKWYEWWKLLETRMKLSFAHIILALLLLHISLRKRESIMSPKL